MVDWITILSVGELGQHGLALPRRLSPLDLVIDLGQIVIYPVLPGDDRAPEGPERQV